MRKPFDPSRRRVLQNALTLGAGVSAAAFAGSDDFIGVIGSCPVKPEEEGGIDWIPDVMHPVAAGFNEYDTSQGAPGLVRVWYPTYEISDDKQPHTKPILKHCLARYPVVLFLHGRPPCEGSGGHIKGYFRRWTALPADLARSGYVVVVPEGDPQPLIDPNVQFAADFIDWARTRWEHARWVDKRQDAVAIAGHSFGALQAALVAPSIDSVRACILLSGTWTDVTPDPLAVLQAIDRPSFFTWADDNGGESLLAGTGSLWHGIHYRKYAAHFPGSGHFDYIDPTPDCGADRGPCELVQPVIADLATLFLARHLPPARSETVIPPSLIPPRVTLTAKQQQYVSNRLTGIERIKTAVGCGVDLEWRLGPLPFRLHLGPQ